jgi:hypothetical protein
MQTLGYHQVGIDEQPREGVPLAAQEARLRAYCPTAEERDERL